MRTTVVLDDQKIAALREYTGIREKSALLDKALDAYLHQEASRRLAALGGTDPELEDIPRKRAADL